MAMVLFATCMITYYKITDFQATARATELSRSTSRIIDEIYASPVAISIELELPKSIQGSSYDLIIHPGNSTSPSGVLVRLYDSHKGKWAGSSFVGRIKQEYRLKGGTKITIKKTNGSVEVI